eukprot:Rmarinus@m.4306
MGASSSSEQKPKQVVIIRGLPGSGKTTVAAHVASCICNTPSRVCSIDDFFTSPEGVYTYVPGKLVEAHAACMASYLGAVRDPSVKTVIIDNTNSRLWEYANYIEVAKALGFRVQILELRCPDFCFVKVYFSRCEHTVSLDTCMAIFSRWEKDPRAVLVSGTRDVPAQILGEMN